MPNAVIVSADGTVMAGNACPLSFAMQLLGSAEQLGIPLEKLNVKRGATRSAWWSA